MSGIAVPVESQVKYLRRRCDEIGKIKDSFNASADWELMKKVGHQIKGNASTFGFESLTAFGRRLEAAALSADSASAKQVSAELESEVQRLLKALE